MITRHTTSSKNTYSIRRDVTRFECFREVTTGTRTTRLQQK